MTHEEAVMASTTASGSGLRAVPSSTATTTVAASRAATARTWVAPAVASAIGAFSAVLATWGIVATQTLHMSL
jgi:hypothetical protein